MQPEILIRSSPSSSSSSIFLNSLWIDSAMGIDFAFARAQKSPPGQQIISVNKPKFMLAKDWSLSFCQNLYSLDCSTLGKTRF